MSSFPDEIRALLAALGSLLQPHSAPAASDPESPPLAPEGPGSRAEAHANSSPPAVLAEPRARSVAELLVPAVLCVGTYCSVGPLAAVHGVDSPSCLYQPLAAFVFFGILMSLCTIVCVIERPRGGADVEEALEKKAMGAAMAVSLGAFVLRVLLLLK